MKQKLLSFFLAAIGLVVGVNLGVAQTFNDFEMDLRNANGGILTSEEVSAGTTTSFGFVVAGNGAISRTSTDDSQALGTITGKTGNDHGLQNFVATVKVEGQVRIIMSTCSWGGDVTVKNTANETVASFSTVKGSGGSGCYGGNGKNDDNIISVNYLGEATTLTISGGAYVGYFAVEEISAASAEVSYSLGNVECSGTIVPTGGTFAVGEEYTIPANFTLYKEGYTLTAWTDGTSNYDLGSAVTLQGDLALTPVFTQNTVSLDDRTEAVTINFNLEPSSDAPAISIGEGKTGFRVAQANVNGTVIDVKMDVDNTYGSGSGKLNNSGRSSWCQANNGTKITIPSCKDAVVEMKGYQAFSTTTIDGQSDYTSGTTISYTVANTADNIDIVIGSDCGYLSYIKVTLPFIDTRTPSNLTLTSDASLSLDAGQSQTSQITYTTSSTGAISYESNNTDIATVDAEGVITAVGNGTATITVTQAADATYAAGSATVTVTVTGGTAPTINVAAILNNSTGTLITTDEINNKSNVNFGINASGARVAVDAQDKVATVSGKYHSEHGLTGLSVSVNVPGNVKISVGECTYSGKTITVKNSNNVTVASTTPENACWKNSTSNVAILYYEGGATTLTISGMDYCPYIAVESVENVPELHTINYYNGSTLVSTSQVYDGTALGTLPTPAYDSNSQYFVGWYSDADDMGTKAFASTVPAGDATYYAVLIDAPTTTAGYYTPTTAAELVGTINYANANASQSNPVKIFLKNGTYNLGSAAEITQLTGHYISLIGESLEGTVITNVPKQEGLDKGTLLYNKGNNNYLQDLTLHNNYPYGNSTGRAASLKDEGNYTICKNVWLYSHQDTYYSHRNHSCFYFKGGKISGCVDYMCGQGRVYFDGVTLSNDNRSTYMTANSELYVFNNCVVENGGSTYTFGRAWSATDDFGNPVCVFLNTTLKDNGNNLASTRWTLNGLNTDYAIAGEYGTKNASGADITPESNNITFAKANTSMNTILTEDQANQYTLANTLGTWGTDAAEQAEQATVSNVTLSGTTLSWSGTSDAYLIEKNGEFEALTTETTYTTSGFGLYTVRAANSRGGFGNATAATSPGDITFTLAVGTEVSGLASTPSATDERITSFAAISASSADETGKADLTVKLNCGDETTPAATVGFTVPAGYKFVPYGATAKVQPISNDAYVRLALSDANNSVSNVATSFTQGVITTATLTVTEEKAYTGNVVLSIFCYDGGNTGVTNYRLGTPITISGELVPLPQVLTTTQNMQGYKSFHNATIPYVVDENTKVYVAVARDYDKNVITLSKLAGNVIPANTPVILKTTGLCSEPKSTAYYQMTLTPSAEAVDAYEGDNMLKVTKGGENLGEVYRLGYNTTDGVAFYTWTTSSATEGVVYADKVNANGAKLTFIFAGEEEETPTAIDGVVEDGVADDAAAPAETYNALGQRVGANANGFVIVNGKKYVK